MSQKEIFLTVLNGFLIGIANLIPGVSGGTFALVLGLYDRLLQAITSIGPKTAKAALDLILFRPGSGKSFQEELKRLDALFLAVLGGGLLLSVVIGAKLIQYLLLEQPLPTLALFIGLILPSLSVPYKIMENPHWKDWLYLIPGILLTFLPTLFMGEVTGSESPFLAFLTGMIAISAMILPGISGSYIMLVLGEYQIVIAKLSNVTKLDSLIFLSAFGLGCLVGLLAFTHVVKWLLDHHKSKTMAFLIGLILGSFFILWPFKNFSEAQTIVGRKGEVKRDIQIATATNRYPKDGEETAIASLAIAIGAGLGLGLHRLEKKLSSQN